jgi:hypothetical protein
MKKQGHMFLARVNCSTTKDLNDTEADTISNNELKIRTINEI